jgi:hypothetical protein
MEALTLWSQSMSKFNYELGNRLAIVASAEVGTVIGRAEYSNAEPTYLLRYQRLDGSAVEAWWTESALTLEERKPAEGVGIERQAL